MDSYVWVDSTNPWGPSQRASAHQIFPSDQDLRWLQPHRHPKSPSFAHTRFGWTNKNKHKIKNRTKTKKEKRPILCSWHRRFRHVSFQCVYILVCTYQGRAGRKNPSTSAHSLKSDWQSCSLTLATHAESQSERRKAWATNSRPLREIRKQCGIWYTHKTWCHYILKNINEIGDNWKAMSSARIVHPLWITEVIRFVAVQVLIASVLCKKEEPSWKHSMTWFETRRNKNVTKASGEKSLNLQNKHEHAQSIS